jgi:hypothetical protein
MMPPAPKLSFEDKAASWIDRLKGYDIKTKNRIRVLEILLLHMAQMMDGSDVKFSFHDDSFV